MTQNNIKIAVTGGIGSGKSTVAKIIREQGYTVISCDEIYKNLLTDRSFLNKLSYEFGEVLTDDGKLDRHRLSSIVFADKNKLKKLNNLTHPEIISEAMNKMSGSGIYFCEVPLLFEEGLEKYFDNVIVVLRDKKARIAAVSKRDKIGTEEVISRINNQFNYENVQFEKYYVIHNNSNLSKLRFETLQTLQKINKDLL